MESKEEQECAGFRVLIVEDRAGMRSIIRSILQHLGIQHVEMASNGEEALYRLRCADARSEIENDPGFDLVISDWMMPKMDGLELLHQVRGDKRFSGLPFLMLTSQNDKNSVLAASTFGVTDYIVKPFAARVLEQKILSLVRTKSE